jgi:hypothetical protein
MQPRRRTSQVLVAAVASSVGSRSATHRRQVAVPVEIGSAYQHMELQVLGKSMNVRLTSRLNEQVAQAN